jgi:hypothetical protein
MLVYAMFSRAAGRDIAFLQSISKSTGREHMLYVPLILDSEHEEAKGTFWAGPPKSHTLKDEVFGKQRKETTSISCWVVLNPEHAKAREPFRHILKVSIAFRRSRKTFVFSVFVLNSAGRRELLSISSPLLESTHSRARALFEIFQEKQTYGCCHVVWKPAKSREHSYPRMPFVQTLSGVSDIKCHLCSFSKGSGKTYNNLLKSLETEGKKKTYFTSKTFLKASSPILDSCSNRHTCNR